MPFTRRFVGAPFIVLAFRASPPTDFIRPKNDPFTGQVAAHLAHMNDGIGDDTELREKVHGQTTVAKMSLLGSDLLSTARAQITFALPAWSRDILGPGLKSRLLELDENAIGDELPAPPKP
jgi:hypothetical protein